MTYNKNYNGKQSHIRNVYISIAHRTPRLYERILVIETDLTLPQSRFAAKDAAVDDLLLELHMLKKLNPVLFSEVDTVEIRGVNDNVNAINARKTDSFPTLPGERFGSSSVRADMSAV